MQQQQAVNRKIMRSELESIKKFASSYVGSIIEEAIKQSSSKSSWLIHCSETCHQINLVQRNQCNSFLFWTPEEELNERSSGSHSSSISTINAEMCHLKGFALECEQSADADGEVKHLDVDLYSLPADTITIYDKEAENGPNGGSSSSSSSSSSNNSRCYKMSNHNCLKPKAYHALSLLKSHHKTLNDLKLFLINLYSSNDLAVKKIGSDHSAFTRYYKRTNVVNTSPSTDAAARRTFTSNKVCESVENYEVEEEEEEEDYVIVNGEKKNESRTASTAAAAAAATTAFYQKREENRNILRLNNENSAVRKCNKIKRRNFFNIKRSFRKVFKSSSSPPPPPPHDGKDRLQQSSFDREPACRSLPPLPPSDQNRPKRTFSFGKGGGGGKQTSMLIDVGMEHTYLEALEKKETRDRGKDQCVMSGDKLFDFVSNIEKVKDHGWYWGPMTREAAEKLLINEPDGSFIVRDSSDDSFGNYTKFKSQTIVDFIENAIQHSKSGRYLFFLHHRPILGPMRVQLLYPVSRFKYVQSLQHSCRFVILKTVRKDLIPSLPLPKSLIEYLNSKDYYTEQRF